MKFIEEERWKKWKTNVLLHLQKLGGGNWRQKWRRNVGLGKSWPLTAMQYSIFHLIVIYIITCWLSIYHGLHIYMKYPYISTECLHDKPLEFFSILRASEVKDSSPLRNNLHLLNKCNPLLDKTINLQTWILKSWLFLSLNHIKTIKIKNPMMLKIELVWNKLTPVSLNLSMYNSSYLYTIHYCSIS